MLTLLFALLIGVTLGLLGGGGSILAVPVLAYGAELPAKEAIATSLVVVGASALFAMLAHARRGHVAWRIGLLFSLSAMIGGYLGGRAADAFNGTTLLLLFAAMMVVTGLAMLRGKAELKAEGEKRLSFWLISAEGLVVGAVTGLVGAGGGFLVVPALVLLGGMEMHKAVGTSLLVIALKSFAAFSGHVAHVSIDWGLALMVTGLALTGSLLGAAFSRHLPEETLRKAFGAFVLAMAGYVVWREAGLLATMAGAFVVLATALWWRLAAWRSSAQVLER